MNKEEIEYCGLKIVVNNETYDEYKGTLEEQIEILQQENKELKEKQNYDLKWALKYDELHKENQELTKKYLNAVADYETTMAEKEQLNSLVNSCQEEIRQLKKQLEGLKSTNKVLSEELTKDKILKQDCLTTCCGIPIGDIPKLINQQKEFIEYMNKTIEELECEDVDDEEMKGYLIQRINTFKEILQKYKKIIGVSDENN